jgi:hypothetical protein
MDYTNIGRSELNSAIDGLLKGGVAIPIYGGVQDEATVGVAIRRHIRSAPGKAKPKGRTRTDPADRLLPAAIRIPITFL